jgi:hypothetical protein
VLGALHEGVLLTGSGAHATDTVAAMRKLDRRWHDLRIALRPLQTQRVVVWNPDVELATGSLLCCLHWARVLSNSARRGGLRDEVALNTAGVGAAHVASIVARLDSLVARYGGGAAGAVRGASDGRVPLMPAVDFDVDKAPALAQLDGAVTQLFDRLMQPVSDTRRVFNWALRGRGV